MIAFTLCLLVGQAASLTAVSDERSLKEFVEAGEKYNLDRKISSEQLRRAVADFDSAWGALLPAVTANGSYTYNQYDASIDFAKTFAPLGGVLGDLIKARPFDVTPDHLNELMGLTGGKPTVIVPHNQLDASIRVDLPIIDAARWARISGTGAVRDATEAREALMIDNTRRSVISAYYAFVGAVAVRASAYKAIGASEAQLKLIEARRSVGASTELDLMRARAEVESRRQVIADTEAMVATSGRLIRTLTGKQPSPDLGMPTDDLRQEPSFDELEKGSDTLPAIRAANYDLSSAKRLSLGSNLTLIPTVTATFLERFTNATGFQNTNNLYTFAVAFTWRLDVPTFQQMRVNGALAETSKLQAEKQRLASRDQIHSDWQRWNAAMIKIKATGTQVEAVQRAAQVARDRYAVGATTQFEVIQAERDLFVAEVQQIQAKTELAVARSSLRISAGRPLEL